MPIESISDLWSNVGEEESLVHGQLRDLGIGSRNHVTSIISASEVYQVSRVLSISREYLQSCNLALNISGIPSSSLNTDFDRSPFVDG
jgi:hypothetical protein